ncbi:hypothetical protein PM082_017981 [Marasmius tenuissimus]|nr:hypothetical protein PM082_017981 [Marasmius tenuissimus]
MFRYLFTHRSGFASTDAILVKLTRLIVETGLLTTTVAVVDVILFSVFKHDNYHLVPARILSKLYSNSMMVLLNSRFRFNRDRRDGRCHSVEPAINLSWAVGPNTDSQSQRTSTTYRLTDFSTSEGSTTSSVPTSEGMATKTDELHS